MTDPFAQANQIVAQQPHPEDDVHDDITYGQLRRILTAYSVWRGVDPAAAIAAADRFLEYAHTEYD